VATASTLGCAAFFLSPSTMSYVVIARKYRPSTFDEVVGQEPIATTLKNAIRTDRVAHAYLFSGPRGVGKTSMARILAKALNCTNGPTDSPCNQCEVCLAVTDGNDIDVLEIDGASNNRVDEIRELRQNVKYAPNRARFKIYIIDEVHMLSTGAFNALLKTLEEPPSHVKFIFATTEPRKVPETIQSRCQRFDFRRVTTADIVGRLEQICQSEGIEFEPNVLPTIARSVRGGMRDSQSILDQLVAFSDGALKVDDVHTVLGLVSEEQIARLVDDFADGNVGDALTMVDELFSEGHDVGEFLDQVIGYLRDVLVSNTCGSDSSLIDRSEEARARMTEQAAKLNLDTWMYALHVMSEVKKRARENVQSRVLLEMAVMKLARLEDLKPLSEIAQRIASLEQLVSAGRLPAGPAPQAAAPPPQSPRPASRPVRQPPPDARAPQQPRAPQPSPPPRAEGRREPPPSAPPPAPSQPPPAEEKAEPSPPGEPGDLAGRWPEVAERVKQQKRLLGEVLSSASRFGGVKGSDVTIYLASSGHTALLAESDDRRLVEEAIAAVVGQRLQLKVEVDPEGAKKPDPQPSRPAADTQPKQASSAAILDEPVVKDAIKRFKGRVNGVETL